MDNFFVTAVLPFSFSFFFSSLLPKRTNRDYIRAALAKIRTNTIRVYDSQRRDLVMKIDGINESCLTPDRVGDHETWSGMPGDFLFPGACQDAYICM